MIPKPIGALEWSGLRKLVFYKGKKMYTCRGTSITSVYLRTVGDSSSKETVVPLEVFFETYSIFNNTATIEITL